MGDNHLEWYPHTRRADWGSCDQGLLDRSLVTAYGRENPNNANKAGVVSVPKLLLKQQVNTEHSAENAFVNSLIHILQSLIPTLLTTPCIT